MNGVVLGIHDDQEFPRERTGIDINFQFFTLFSTFDDIADMILSPVWIIFLRLR
jgi:hypothetical protein